MKMNLNLLKVLSLVLLFAGCVAGDVGQEKSAAGTNSASNPTFATSSPTAIVNIQEASPIQTFSATLSNPGGVAFRNKWYVNGALRQTDSTNVLSNFFLNPLTEGAGTFVVQAQLTDGATAIYDINTWTVNIAATNPAFAVTNGLTGAAKKDYDVNDIFQINVTDIASKGFVVRWRVNGVIEQTDAANTSPSIFSYDPELLSEGGTHNTILNANTVSFEIMDLAVTTQYPGQTQTFNFIVTQDNPQFTAPAPGAPGPVVTLSIDTVSNLDFATTKFTNPSGLSFFTNWYVDGVRQPAEETANTVALYNTNPSTMTPVPFGPLNPGPDSTKNHTVEARITSLTAGSGATYHSITWNVDVSLPVPVTNVVNVTPDPTGPDTYHAVINNQYASAPSTAGVPVAFFKNGTSSTRGTAFDYTPAAEEDFCIQVDDHEGFDAGGAAEVAVVWYKVVDTVETAISPPLPAGTTITVDSTDVCLSDSISDFTALFTGGTTHLIRARVTDPGAGGIEVDDNPTEWTIAVQAENTAPTIVISTACQGAACLAAGTVGVPTPVLQGSTQSFGVIVTDIDSDPTLNADFQFDFTFIAPSSSPVDGIANFVGSDVLSPDCVRAPGDPDATTADADTRAKYVCSLTFPSTAPLGSLPIGPYTLQAVVTDAGSPFTVTPQASTVAQWFVTTTESVNLPTLDLKVIGVSAALNQDTQSFVYNVASAADSIAAANEGDTIGFNLVHSDVDRDNYTRTIRVQTEDSGFVDIETFAALVSGTNPVTNTTRGASDTIVEKDAAGSVTWTIPQSLVNQSATGAGVSRAVIFRIELIGNAQAGPEATVTEDFTITINDVNPQPVWGATTDSPDAGAGFDGFVTAGYPFSINPGPEAVGDLTDASIATTLGDTFVYQWQVANLTVAGVVSCTDAALTSGPDTGDYRNVAGATARVLAWTPPINSADGNQLCFRLCVGDNGFGNPADCSGGETIGGPWGGVANDGIATIRPADRTGTASINGHAATWKDTATNFVYVAQTDVLGTSITLTEYSYNAATGAYAAAQTDTSTSDPNTGATFLEPAANLSITGNATQIFVAYEIAESDLLTPSITPVFRVKRYDRATLTEDTTDINIVTSFVGDIMVDGINWYVPFIDVANGGKVSVAVRDITNGSGVATTTLNTTIVGIEVKADIDTVGDNMIFAIRNTSSEIDLMTYATTAVASGPITDTAVTTLTNVFTGTVTMPAISSDDANSKVYVAAQNSSSQLEAVSYALPGLTGESKAVVNATIPEINNVQAFTIEHGTTVNELWLATVVAPGNAFVTKLTGTPLTTLTADVSEPINASASTVTSASQFQLSLSAVHANFAAGTPGAIVGEEQKDTIFATFYDGTNIHTTIINTEVETLSAPAAGTDFGIPFFK